MIEYLSEIELGVAGDSVSETFFGLHRSAQDTRALGAMTREIVRIGIWREGSRLRDPDVKIGMRGVDALINHGDFDSLSRVRAYVGADRSEAPGRILDGARPRT